jgi:hypothetical protein
MGILRGGESLKHLLFALALQGALIGTLVFGTERLPKDEWNDRALSITQTKSLQGFLALCVVFHHCAQKVFLGRWWYNTAILFPLGCLFGQHEPEAWAWMKRSYRKQVACSVTLFVSGFLLSVMFTLAVGSPALYTLLVLVCAMVSTLLFKQVTKRLLGQRGVSRR